MKTFKRLFMLFSMLFCCSAMFANYYYSAALTGESDYFYSLLSENDKKDLQDVKGGFPVTVEVNEYEMDTAVHYEQKNIMDIYPNIHSELWSTIAQREELKRINAELKAKTLVYIDDNGNETQNIDNAKKFICGTREKYVIEANDSSDSRKDNARDWSPMSPLDFFRECR